MSAALKLLAALRGLWRQAVADWRADSERLNAHNRAACAQRDAERAQWLIWRGIVQ